MKKEKNKKLPSKKEVLEQIREDWEEDLEEVEEEDFFEGEEK